MTPKRSTIQRLILSLCVALLLPLLAKASRLKDDLDNIDSEPRGCLRVINDANLLIALKDELIITGLDRKKDLEEDLALLRKQFIALLLLSCGASFSGGLLVSRRRGRIDGR